MQININKILCIIQIRKVLLYFTYDLLLINSNHLSFFRNWSLNKYDLTIIKCDMNAGLLSLIELLIIAKKLAVGLW